MKASILVLAFLHVGYCTCPEGFDLVRDGECRGLAATVPFTFDDAGTKAVQECEKLQAKPVFIHDDEHEKYWTSLAKKESFLMLGIICKKTKRTQEWAWADGSKLDYKPVLEGWHPALDQPCVADFSWYIQPNGAWNYRAPNGSPANFYCTKQLEHEDENGCTDEGVCFEVGATAENWQDAQSTCQMFGAELATIHNENDNSFVRRMAISKGAVYGVFVGASAKKDGSYGWIDGSSMDYQNFYPGFPKKNFGDCIAMDTSTATGQWMNTDCNSKLPVACMKKRANSGPPVCTGEDYDEGSIITTPGFPYLASTACDYFLSVAPGKKVQLKIVLLEANSCCDTLVLYDGYVGGSVLARVSGNIVNTTYTTTTSNVMRVSWQPNGGVNVRGLAMTYRAV